MDLDEDLCVCFHVSQRKVLNFLRIERPKRCGQLSGCFGAGTGCGWCRPFLRRLFEEAVATGRVTSVFPTREEYCRMRAKYLQETEETTPTEGGDSDCVPESPTGD